jgi:hypothetical protein
MAMKRMLGRSAARVGVTSKQEMRSARIFFMVLGDRNGKTPQSFIFWEKSIVGREPFNDGFYG